MMVMKKYIQYNLHIALYFVENEKLKHNIIDPIDLAGSSHPLPPCTQQILSCVWVWLQTSDNDIEDLT
jgi:hypothetical protein